MSNPFDITNYDLGDNKMGIDRLGIDQLFSSTHISSQPKCLICNNVALYKLVPKHKHLNTAEIEDKGYACGYCIEQGYLRPEDYKLREL